ncbi:MAG: hypothetical protein IJ379_15170 [Lachnospiraceae bacterium]|nr:hypothetical protein [Lachnospiraceae bacterium]MBQ7777258.1 hypothetical protein [Lachnospiraceae bacterium]
MGYKRAEEILPTEIIELIQQYVDGESIYIPRKAERRLEWGSSTGVRQEISCRNQEIFEDYVAGMSVAGLTQKYFLSEKSIQRIIREKKR